MSVETFLDKILEAKTKLENIPCGIVISDKVYEVLRKYKYRYACLDDVDENKLFQMPIYHLPDTPDDEAVVFYDEKKMKTYLTEREGGLSHEDALLKSIGNVSTSSLIQNLDEGES